MGTSAPAGWAPKARLVAAIHDMLLASDDLPILWLEHMITYVHNMFPFLHSTGR